MYATNTQPECLNNNEFLFRGLDRRRSFHFNEKRTREEPNVRIQQTNTKKNASQSNAYTFVVVILGVAAVFQYCQRNMRKVCVLCAIQSLTFAQNETNVCFFHFISFRLTEN